MAGGGAAATETPAAKSSSLVKLLGIVLVGLVAFEAATGLGAAAALGAEMLTLAADAALAAASGTAALLERRALARGVVPVGVVVDI